MLIVYQDPQHGSEYTTNSPWGKAECSYNSSPFEVLVKNQSKNHSPEELKTYLGNYPLQRIHDCFWKNFILHKYGAEIFQPNKSHYPGIRPIIIRHCIEEASNHWGKTEDYQENQCGQNQQQREPFYWFLILYDDRFSFHNLFVPFNTIMNQGHGKKTKENPK